MQISDIPKGGQIELEVKYNGRTVNFNSDVREIINNTVLITAITSNDLTVGFTDNVTINFLYKIDGKVYLWENVTVKLVKYDGNIYHKLDLLGEGKPYNRRGSFRVYIGEDMPIYVNTATGPTALQVLVKDISETGVGFITKEEFDTDRTVRLKLKDSTNVISLSGIIVRKEFLPNLNAYLYGCKFNERNLKLGKYIAKKQGEQLKKKSPVSAVSSTQQPGKKQI